MKKVPKRHMDQFTMFLSVVGFTAKTNADGSITFYKSQNAERAQTNSALAERKNE